MEEAEFNLYRFYQKHRRTELCLSEVGFRNLLSDRGRKVYAKGGTKQRLVIKLNEQSEVCLASVVPKPNSAQLVCFSAACAAHVPFRVLLCEKFFHHFDGEARATMYVSRYGKELCTVVSDYEGSFNLPFLLAVTRHHFQVNLVFVPNLFFEGRFDDRCLRSLPCPEELPFLV